MNVTSPNQLWQLAATGDKKWLIINKGVGIGATSPIGSHVNIFLAEAISSAPSTSRIACHLRIPTKGTGHYLSDNGNVNLKAQIKA